ncbi:sensor histidine kinase [Streptomyces sp. NBC_01186]|uniref:sensor histidine kinase n=1 Tax=Streptomyces sp. NBC_01186 TaxID=2903765 RepID=UPI002E0E97FB|nr:sensor histidine kinase [Streptomyces sp. NBC_01186]
MGSATVWGELRRGAERVPARAYDGAIALAITAVSLLLGNDRTPQGWHGPDVTGVVLTCVVNLPLAARRKAPVVLCTGVLAVWAVYIALDYWPVVNTLGPLLALYTVASMRPLREAAFCALLLAGLWNFAGTTGQESSWATVLGQSVLYTTVICGFGHLARKAAQRNVELARLAEQLRKERAGAERRAVAEERVRIARELHDVVAHHMSVISVQAGLAGYVFDSDPQTARGALGTISDTSGEALAELRRLLAVLRIEDGDRLEGGRLDGGRLEGGGAEGQRPAGDTSPGGGSGLERGPGGEPDFGPAPGVDQLPALAERVRGAGVPVLFTVTGEQRVLAPGAGQCAYRVVQEALTNVLKHACPAQARVTVAYEPRQFTVTVTDDGSGQAPAHQLPSGGHGLIGMRERARIYGGRLHAGPRASGGFEVRLILPA